MAISYQYLKGDAERMEREIQAKVRAISIKINMKAQWELRVTAEEDRVKEFDKAHPELAGETTNLWPYSLILIAVVIVDFFLLGAGIDYVIGQTLGTNLALTYGARGLAPLVVAVIEGVIGLLAYRLTRWLWSLGFLIALIPVAFFYSVWFSGNVPQDVLNLIAYSVLVLSIGGHMGIVILAPTFLKDFEVYRQRELPIKNAERARKSADAEEQDAMIEVEKWEISVKKYIQTYKSMPATATFNGEVSKWLKEKFPDLKIDDMFVDIHSATREAMLEILTRARELKTRLREKYGEFDIEQSLDELRQERLKHLGNDANSSI